MLKKELTAALAVIGALSPFAVNADQTMSGMGQQGNTQKPAFDAGESVRMGVLPGAYNEAASYRIEDSYDVYFTADFIYWALQQDGVRVGNELTAPAPGALGLLNSSDSVVFRNAKYKPGFQVGMGFTMKGMDWWNLYAEYTWYKNTDTQSASGTVATPYADHNLLPGVGSDIVVASSASSEQTYHFNNVNLQLQRPFYFGRKLTANFGAGLRALWVSDSFTNNTTGLLAYPLGLTTQVALLPQSSYYKQKSWALGPRFEFGSSWMLGAGFKIIADMAASVLYTRYTTLETSLTGGVRTVAGVPVTASVSTSPSSSYNVLRAVTESSLAIGWGSYFGDNDDFHFDLTAGYEFNIYWNQNMVAQIVTGNGSPGNTYLHGLNVAVRFDF